MATLTITIPNEKVTLLKKALGYEDKVIDGEGNEIDNPQSATQYAEKWITEQLKRQVWAYERSEAVRNLQETDLGIIS